jgi:hypothetical protein
MRKWYVPLTVLGLGSLGALLLSDRGRNTFRGLLHSVLPEPDQLLEWNDSLPAELDRIQATLNRIAESLGPHPEVSR